MGDEDVAAGLVAHLVRNRAEEEALCAAHPLVADDDEVDGLRIGEAEERVGGVPGEQARVDRDAGVGVLRRDRVEDGPARVGLADVGDDEPPAVGDPSVPTSTAA
jgi:hypothetical protein